MVPSASPDWLVAQTEKKRQGRRHKQAEREGGGGGNGGWRETQTDRKTEWLIRICLFH